MGTAGIVHFHDGDISDETICFVYKQSDGYPDSLGEQIKTAFGRANLVNGIRFDIDNQVNGMGCAAAQFIAQVKTGVGGIYMLSEAKDWADFDYHIFYVGKLPEPGEDPTRLHMKVLCGKDEIWSGEIRDFDASTLFDDEDA